MKRTKFNLSVMLIVLVYALILLIGNIATAQISVATMPGSYASEFAEKHRLNHVDLAETQQAYFDQRYEEFEYSESSYGLCLEEYKGVSQELVIPASINGKTVTALGEEFFANSPMLEDVYLSDHIFIIYGEVDDDVTLYCSKDSVIYEDNQPVEDDDEKAKAELWDVESVYDSTFINFALGDIPFEYNKSKSLEIELVAYTGSEDVLVIPSYINGMPVTTISFDLLGKFDLVVLPDTVTEINGEVSRVIFSDAFAVQLVMTLLAYVVIMLSVNVILPRMNKAQEMHLSMPQLVLSFVYIVGQVLFSILAIYLNIIPASLSFAISLIWMVLYVVLFFVSGTGRSHAIKIEEKVEQKTSWMKEFKLYCADLADGVNDPALKKQLNRLVENIRYSDPSSNEQLSGIESQLDMAISELRLSISKGNAEDIMEKCSKAQNLLAERNRQCRQYKK